MEEGRSSHQHSPGGGRRCWARDRILVSTQHHEVIHIWGAPWNTLMHRAAAWDGGDGTQKSSVNLLLYQGSLVESPDAPNHLSVPQPSSVSLGKFFKVIIHTHLRDWFFKCSTSHCDIKGPVFSNVPLFCHWLLSKLVKVKSELPILQTEMLPLTVIGFESIPELCAALPLLQSSGDSISASFLTPLSGLQALKGRELTSIQYLAQETAGSSGLRAVLQITAAINEVEMCSSGSLQLLTTSHFMCCFNICCNLWNYLCGSWHRRGDCWIDILFGNDENLFKKYHLNPAPTEAIC